MVCISSQLFQVITYMVLAIVFSIIAFGGMLGAIVPGFIIDSIYMVPRHDYHYDFHYDYHYDWNDGFHMNDTRYYNEQIAGATTDKIEKNLEMRAAQIEAESHKVCNI